MTHLEFQALIVCHICLILYFIIPMLPETSKMMTL